MDDITKRRIETRKRQLVAQVDTLKEAGAWVMAGTPVDIDWWNRQFEDARTKLDALAALTPPGCDKSIQAIYTALDIAGSRAVAMWLDERAGR